MRAAKMLAIVMGLTGIGILVTVGIALAGITVTIENATIGVNDVRTLEVTAQGDLEWNTYGSGVSVPSGLQLLDVKEGPYLPSICGNTFFSWNGSSVSNSLLCYQTFVTGPGVICKIEVKGLTVGQHQVGTSSFNFYRAGYPASPVTVSGGLVTVTGGGGGGCHDDCELEKPRSTWSTVKALYVGGTR